jgi:hypothetical protein
MKHLVAFPMKNGSTIVVEVDEPESEGGVVRAARPGEIVETARQTFEDAVARIQPAAEAIIGRLRELAEPPDEAEVGFGIKLSANAGAIFAWGGGEANFTVTLKWKRKEEQKDKYSAK